MLKLVVADYMSKYSPEGENTSDRVPYKNQKFAVELTGNIANILNNAGVSHPKRKKKIYPGVYLKLNIYYFYTLQTKTLLYLADGGYRGILIRANLITFTIQLDNQAKTSVCFGKCHGTCRA